MSTQYAVVFTGGGSGGHTIPASVLIRRLRSNNSANSKHILLPDLYCIGSIEGIERRTLSDLVLRYFPIRTGKIRRYISLRNISDMAGVLLGLVQSFFFLLRLKNEYKKILVFSTGGFVAVPSVIAARLLNIHVFIHEQTSRAGLANKISSFCASKIFISFNASAKSFPHKKTIFSGYPLREECYDPERKPLFINGKVIETRRPILLITGGGNGSQLINQIVRENLALFRKHFLVIHLTGKAFIKDFEKYADDGYHPAAGLGDEMINAIKHADLLITRAGAGIVSEIITLKKKAVFIPLKIAQKNEQYYNAKEAVNSVGGLIFPEEELPGTNWDTVFGQLTQQSAAAGKCGRDDSSIVCKVNKRPDEVLIQYIINEF